MHYWKVIGLQKLQAIRQGNDKDRIKLEKKFKDRLKDMDSKMKALHKKERDNMHLERLKVKSEQTCARLNDDILGIKQQKVSLRMPSYSHDDSLASYNPPVILSLHGRQHVALRCRSISDVVSNYVLSWLGRYDVHRIAAWNSGHNAWLNCVGQLDEADGEVKQGLC